MLREALRREELFLATSPSSTGLIYHLRLPAPAEVLALPLGATLLSEVTEDARLLAELRGLPEAERRRDLEEARRQRRLEAGRMTWEEVLAAHARELPDLQRLAWSLVRAVSIGERHGQVCLVLDGVEGWAAPPEAERVPVEALHCEQLSRIALTATLGAVGAWRRAVSLPGDTGAVGGSPGGA